MDTDSGNLGERVIYRYFVSELDSLFVRRYRIDSQYGEMCCFNSSIGWTESSISLVTAIATQKEITEAEAFKILGIKGE